MRLHGNRKIPDVEIENENTFGLNLYYPDEFTQILKKINIIDGVISEAVLNTRGTGPDDLHISSTGIRALSYTLLGLEERGAPLAGFGAKPRKPTGFYCK